MPRPRGVWIAGPSRSGTSMVAGLFAAHGVFFGKCISGNEFNPKGYFEHPYIKGLLEQDLPDDWPTPWWDRMESEGWDGGPWGVKGGPRLDRVVRGMKPSVLVVCRRPLPEIAQSRNRVPWARQASASVTVGNYKSLDRIGWPRLIVNVRTPLLIRGKYADIQPAFRALGIRFDRELAGEWIDPNIWGRP